MKNYIVYNTIGKILRTGVCGEDVRSQAGENEYAIEGTANDVTQKIVDGEIVDKTPAEIEADNPAPIPLSLEKQPAHITNGQWQEIQDRLRLLENKE